MKIIRTVTGDIDARMLGLTLMHEHFFWDQSCYLREDPPAAPEGDITLSNRTKVFFNMHQSRNNIVQLDEQVAIDEAKCFALRGGDAICDLTSHGIGRNAAAIRRVSLGTGLKVVMSTGLYIESSHPECFRSMSVEQLADFFAREINEGEEDTGIKAGLIGEIGVSDDFTDREREVLQAAAIAQRRTGAAISIHPPIFRQQAHEILDILERSGADLNRVVMGHCDPTLEHVEYHDSITKRGAYIEYDQFGLEIPVNYGPYQNVWLPRDIDRIRAIRRQIELGNLRRILVSQDTAFKFVLKCYGGGGYAHIIENLLPFFLHEGIGQDSIDTILIENPREILALAGT